MESLVILLAILAVAHIARLGVNALPLPQPPALKPILIVVIALVAGWYICKRCLGLF